TNQDQEETCNGNIRSWIHGNPGGEAPAHRNADRQGKPAPTAGLDHHLPTQAGKTAAEGGTQPRTGLKRQPAPASLFAFGPCSVISVMKAAAKHGPFK